VIASQRVNVRSGPSTETQPVSSLAPGEEVAVLGRNGDGTWIQVQLADGRDGWISASLVEITAREADEATPTDESSALIVVMAGADISGLRPRPVLQDEATPEATADATTEAAIEVTTEVEVSEVLPEAADATVVSVIPYAEERWYGMTLGLVVIILVIALGTLVNIVRGIIRRRRA
jgi:uncharacterized protein YgiM (DUF1202 family)